MGEVAAAARDLAAELHARGVRRGDVVLTLIGNRPEWVLTMLACFRQGHVVLPCMEQLRAGDLRHRLAIAQPALVVAHARNEAVLRAAGWTGPRRPCTTRGRPRARRASARPAAAGRGGSAGRGARPSADPTCPR